ncbi:MAG: hypothetical protein M1819_006047 [Sarea resinae]|nr:MAG: hypothetical protein M1819_006047 [Sarea resinae]
MPSRLEALTAFSSIGLRVCCYLFLRWFPASGFPLAINTLFAVYLPAFVKTFFETSPYEVIADEVDITVNETEGESQPPTLPSSAAHSQNLPDNEKPPVETEEDIEIKETLVLEEQDPHILRTLLTGLPSPTSSLWSLITAGINVALVIMAADFIYRGHVFYPSDDLSFARTGFVSENSAKILIREPDSAQLPLYISYRQAEVPSPADPTQELIADSWKSAGEVFWLTNETDYTTTVTLPRLRPDTRYQYAVSNNHTGFFTTPPPVGRTPAKSTRPFTFLSTSCIKSGFPYNPLSHPLSFPGFRKLAARLPELNAQFMLFLGDFIYIDVPHRFGTDKSTYRSDYRRVYASPDWPAVSTNLPWLHVLDDHEIDNDWERNTTGVYAAAADPFTHYHTSVNPPPVKPGETYFAFTQGPASFFLMDTRRYRSPAQKTMLGPRQLTSALSFLRRREPDGVKWKILISSIPFTKNWRVGSGDTWGGYLEERRLLLEAMWDVGDRGDGVGVVILSGDRHEFAATAFPPPKDGRWPLSATPHEFSTSPLNMFYIPIRTYRPSPDGEDVCIKYLPDGQSKFGAIEISNPTSAVADQGLLRYRLFVDGQEVWSYALTTPPAVEGGGRGKDAMWG